MVNVRIRVIAASVGVVGGVGLSLAAVAGGAESSAEIDAAEQTMGSVMPAAVTDSLAMTSDDGETFSPTLEATDEGFEAVDTEVDLTISADAHEGYAVETLSGQMTVTPVGVAEMATAGQQTSGGDAVVFAGTQGTAEGSADTVIRPMPDGAETFTTLKSVDSPSSYTWEVQLNGDEELRETDEGGIRIIDPTPDRELADLPPAPPSKPVSKAEIEEQIAAGKLPADTQYFDPGTDEEALDAAAEGGTGVRAPTPLANPPGEIDQPPSVTEIPRPDGPPPSEEAVGEEFLEAFPNHREVEAEPAGDEARAKIEAAIKDRLTRNAELAEEAQLERLNEQPLEVAVIDPPSSIDAAGDRVPTSLEVEENRFTMTVDTDGAAFPIVADPYTRISEDLGHWACCAPTYGWITSWYWAANWWPYGQWYTAYMLYHAGANGWYIGDLAQYGYPGWYEIWWYDRYLAVSGAGWGNIYTLSWYQQPYQYWGVVSNDPYWVPNIQSRDVYYAKPHNFGFNDDFVQGGNTNLINGYLSAAGLAGAEIIRFPISWCMVGRNAGARETELDPSQWHWELYDAAFSAIAAARPDGPQGRKIKVIAEPLDSPAWANDVATQLGDCSTTNAPESDPATPPDDQHLDDWTTFVNKVINRYGQNGSVAQAQIVAVEAWNEPNIPRFWGSTVPKSQFNPQPGRFARIVNAVHDANAVGNNLPVLPGGMSPERSPANTLAQALDQNASSHIRPAAVDGISIHAYATTVPEIDPAVQQLKDQYNEIVNAATSAGFGSVDRWVTEVGYPLRAGVAGQAVEDKYRQVYVMAGIYDWLETRPGIRSIIVHRLVDGFEEPEYVNPDGTPGPNRGFGAIRPMADPSQNKLRPLWCSLADQQGLVYDWASTCPG